MDKLNDHGSNNQSIHTSSEDQSQNVADGSVTSQSADQVDQALISTNVQDYARTDHMTVSRGTMSGQLATRVRLAMSSSGQRLIDLNPSEVNALNLVSEDGATRIRLRPVIIERDGDNVRCVRFEVFDSSNDGDYSLFRELGSNAYLVEDVGDHHYSGILIALGHGVYWEVLFDPTNHRIVSTRVEVAGRILDGIVGFEPEGPEGDNTYYGITSGRHQRVYLSLIGLDFERWNSHLGAFGYGARSILGAAFNASKEQELDLRTLLHFIATIFVMSQLVNFFDEVVSPSAMVSANLPTVSYTGSSDPTPNERWYIARSTYAMLIVNIIASAYKEMLACQISAEVDSNKQKAMARLVFTLEVLGAQFLSGLAASAWLIAGSVGHAGKILIDNVAPGTIGAGLGGYAQSVLLARGWSPLVGYAAYVAFRISCYRMMVIGSQIGTTAMFVGEPYFTEYPPPSDTQPKVDFHWRNGTHDHFLAENGGNQWLPFLTSIVVSQFIYEISILSGGLGTYLAAYFRPQDKHEEQAIRYGEDAGIQIHWLNRLRVVTAQTIDALSRLIGIVTQPLTSRITRYLNQYDSTTLGVSLRGLTQEQVQALKKLNQRDVKQVEEGATPSPLPSELLVEEALRAELLEGIDQQNLDAIRQFVDVSTQCEEMDKFEECYEDEYALQLAIAFSESEAAERERKVTAELNDELGIPDLE